MRSTKCLRTSFAENSYEISTISLLISTIIAIFLLHNATDTASLIFFQSQSQRSLESVSRPQINWNAIKPITNKSSPFANFRSDKWIIVSISGYPSNSLKKLVKIKGWQAFCIGNSRTPNDWNLKGFYQNSLISTLVQKAFYSFWMIPFLITGICFKWTRLSSGLPTRF
ncbi:hypothetical protein CFOL_v3_20731 [Cephalotus follicularis]|uniref:Uncharacterized protein n=1 Tax=Cephalotus follicularis TaxID=3775 RepID=A0A1Q3CAI6_CEPFO|nr:hypothetical protein CFOL_v3_20731 [Cephalotus follicularis]